MHEVGRRRHQRRVVANDRDGSYDRRCKLQCVEALDELIKGGRTVLDRERRILSEYLNNLSEVGQPGVGDHFLKFLLQNQMNKKRVKYVELQRGSFPNDPQLAEFDLEDRKFAVAARLAKAPVLNAVDSDWWHHKDALKRNGISVHFVCGVGHFKARGRG